ncbi:hypothetical protein PUNSTDRAFT_97438 [Punctularia strigosozonata HHB-11173 SS5]|uniref:uncharacterized protein n=1 Tax=Punctularia strigosozonata (strain HHB-11173) TaxID=741275 RepID=UPI0004416F87|nr:uncharacterized protein PUNSTDRAFT_97438 [Punctularia strigosozonata HHB-11173 SS5]EIN12637.1 hypothetical protein PUNSTDRAFT_97438 [Punctularia strigosozonata HHB-11173 SS5]
MAPLPGDVLMLIMYHLELTDLLVLSLTCHYLHDLVASSGWAQYARTHQRYAPSLSPLRESWSKDPLAQLCFHAETDRAWAKAACVARPLMQPWHGKLQPLMAISPSRLVVAAGSDVYAYAFEGPGARVRFDCLYHLREPDTPRRDVTGLAFVSDSDCGDESVLCVGFEDGVLELVTLPSPPEYEKELGVPADCRTPLDVFAGDLIESLCSCSSDILSLSLSGQGTFISLASSLPSSASSSCSDSSDSIPLPSFPYTTIDLPGRGWSSHLNMSASTPYAAFGTSSPTPLVLHALLPDTGFSREPLAILGAGTKVTSQQSAVYGIARAPSHFPWGGPDPIVVSGWYDGVVRVHDLRASSRSDHAGLTPVMKLYDPWSTEPIYSVAAGGGSGSHIAAGSARHSVVSFWDVRASPTHGFSIHGPGNDPSPVYSLVLESSRLFGATQSRAFVYDFGPDVSTSTYPPLPTDTDFVLPDVPAPNNNNNNNNGGRRNRTRRTQLNEGLKRPKDWNGIGYYVTKYSHNRGVASKASPSGSWR